MCLCGCESWSPAEDWTVDRVFEYRMLRRIFRPTRRLEKLHTDDFRGFCCSLSIRMGGICNTHVKQKGSSGVKVRMAEGKATSKAWAWMGGQ